MHCFFRFILNPNANSKEELEHLRFLGILMGIAIRTKKPLNLHLAPTVWKQIVNIQLAVEDIEEVKISSHLLIIDKFYYFQSYLLFISVLSHFAASLFIFN